MAHGNYTVSTISSTELTGDSVSAGTIDSSQILVITPNAGFNVSAASFSVGNPYPIEVLDVVFSNTTTANTAGNLVHVTVTYNNFVMPAANKDILVDIDGEAIRQVSSGVPITACLIDNVLEEGACVNTQWPKTGLPVSASLLSPTSLCAGYFEDVTEGPGITATNLPTNTSWTNPMSALHPSTTTIDQAYVTQHTGSALNSVDTVLFTKTFWCGPNKFFEIDPEYQLNASALASNMYTVEATPTNYNVDKIILVSSTDNHVVTVDTTDVYPGMQVTGTTLSSIAGPPYAVPIGYPSWNQDIRVTSVNSSAGTVSLSEAPPGTLAAGDVLNFNSICGPLDYGTVISYPVGDICLTRTFVVKFNSSTSPVCGDHEIDFWMFNGFPDFTHSNAASPLISNVNINTSNIPASGETRNLTINSTGSSVFNLSITRSDNKYYNFTTGLFTASGNVLANQTSEPNVPFETHVTFPSTDADFTYTILIAPTGGVVESNFNNQTTFATGVSGTHVIQQYVDKTITFASDATTTGFTLSSFTSPSTVVMPGAYQYNSKGRRITTWTGTITDSGGAIIYDTGATVPATFTNAGSFTNATANNGQMLLDLVLTGSGTTTITATVNGTIHKQPTANTTVTLDFDTILAEKTTVPPVGTAGNVDVSPSGHVNVDVGELIMIEGVISVSPGSSVAIDLRAADRDANAASKTLATVVVPKDSLTVVKGSLGSHSGGAVTYTADTNISDADIGKLITFTYKGTIGGVDSDPATVYIIIKE